MLPMTMLGVLCWPMLCYVLLCINHMHKSAVDAFLMLNCRLQQQVSQALSSMHSQQPPSGVRATLPRNNKNGNKSPATQPETAANPPSPSRNPFSKPPIPHLQAPPTSAPHPQMTTARRTRAAPSSLHSARLHARARVAKPARGALRARLARAQGGAGGCGGCGAVAGESPGVAAGAEAAGAAGGEDAEAAALRAEVAELRRRVQEGEREMERMRAREEGAKVVCASAVRTAMVHAGILAVERERDGGGGTAGASGTAGRRRLARALRSVGLPSAVAELVEAAMAEEERGRVRGRRGRGRRGRGSGGEGSGDANLEPFGAVGIGRGLTWDRIDGFEGQGGMGQMPGFAAAAADAAAAESAAAGAREELREEWQRERERGLPVPEDMETYVEEEMEARAADERVWSRETGMTRDEYVADRMALRRIARLNVADFHERESGEEGGEEGGEGVEEVGGEQEEEEERERGGVESRDGDVDGTVDTGRDAEDGSLEIEAAIRRRVVGVDDGASLASSGASGDGGDGRGTVESGVAASGRGGSGSTASDGGLLAAAVAAGEALARSAPDRRNERAEQSSRRRRRRGTDPRPNRLARHAPDIPPNAASASENDRDDGGRARRRPRASPASGPVPAGSFAVGDGRSSEDSGGQESQPAAREGSQETENGVAGEGERRDRGPVTREGALGTAPPLGHARIVRRNNRRHAFRDRMNRRR